MRTKKVTTLIVFALALTGLYYRAYGWFVVPEHIISPLLLASLILSFVITILCAISVHKSGYRTISEYGRLDIKNKVWHRVLAAPLAFLGVSIFIIPAAAY